LCNIGDGAFSPLNGFLNSADYNSVVQDLHLKDGSPWSIPITLEIPTGDIEAVKRATEIRLMYDSEEVCVINVDDVFEVDFDKDLKKIFGTDADKHPGVDKESRRSRWRLGGEVRVMKNYSSEYSEYYQSPSQTKEIFKNMQWETIVGFQTRNPPHRAHEYLQRIGMEVCDGIFIQPLIGWKKKDDFSPEAVLSGYRKQIEDFYPKSRAILGILVTPMRYAGPREALFHALIRKNFGCTHFIVGRDHAGVGDYYGKYEAHELLRRFDNLGINILYLHGPYYCGKCNGIVTDKSCSHGKEFISEISGTQMRSILKKGNLPPEEHMRKEIGEVLISLSESGKLFCGEKN